MTESRTIQEKPVYRTPPQYCCGKRARVSPKGEIAYCHCLECKRTWKTERVKVNCFS